MAKVAMIGAGSIGAYVAAHLVAAGHDVTACVRRPFDSYVVESELSPVSASAHCVSRPEHVSTTFDWVLVGVKAHQTPSIAPWLAVACGSQTRVVALQNGIEAVERLAPLVGEATAMASVVYCDCELLAPGYVVHTARNRLIVPSSPAADQFAALFASTPIHVQPVDDYSTKAWLKLSANVVCNGLTALTRRPIGVLAEPTLLPVATALVAETWSTANADGAAIDARDPGKFVTAIASQNPFGRTSMLMDIEAGRETEHDAMYGAVVRVADRCGVPVPTVRTLLGLLDHAAPLGS